MSKKKVKLSELSASQLRRSFSESDFSFKSTEDLEPLKEIIGQDRALRALQLGLDIESHGFNIFITGFVGSGRTTTIKAYLEKIGNKQKQLYDYCYVNNFQEPDMPTLLVLPAGQGKRFGKDMMVLVETLKHSIPEIIESEEYENRQKSLVNTYKAREKKVFHAFEKKVADNGFTVIQVQYGNYTKPEIAPKINGKTVTMSQLESSIAAGEKPPQDYEQLQEVYAQLSVEMERVLKISRELGRELEMKIEELERNAVLPLVYEMIKDLQQRYPEESVQRYLEQVMQHISEHLDNFHSSADENSESNLAPQFPGEYLGVNTGPPFAEYQVNVIVDNSDRQSVPVIIENVPTYTNLFGTIEKMYDRSGYYRSDFTKIKAGSLLRANGGYLVIDAMDSLTERGVWSTLKRALKNRSLEIQSIEPFTFTATSALKPEAVPIEVKVVMIGDRKLYHSLYRLDPEFKKIFKVKADFDSSMPLTEPNLEKYAAFITRIVHDEALLHFTTGAVAEIVEYGIRLADTQKKLSTRFSDIADLIRESSYWAHKEGSSQVERGHVEQSIKERRQRLNLSQERLQELIEDGTIMISTEGKKIGQVNGLAVYDFGDYSFGKPSRITAQVSSGKAGVINIEREAKLSGKIHDKGVFILSGYLRGKYAQKQPLSMTASLCFEQSYGGVDGDSASSTEIFALLSALSEVPIRQSIAVTGSINQQGEIQPIGGANQKIEGFFDVCNVRGLDGSHGVIIPHQNVKNLMLRKDVVDAVAMGLFHIYPIENVDQGMEVLTGKPAGTPGPRGGFPRGSIHYRVERRLKKLANNLNRGNKTRKSNDNGEKTKNNNRHSEE